MTIGVWQRATGYGHHGMGVIDATTTAFSPASLSPLAWFDATDGTYITGGGTVTQWADRSGNARHISPGTLTSPSYASSAVTCVLATTQGFQSWASNLGTTTWDVLFVARVDASPGFHTILATPSGTTVFASSDASEQYICYNAGAKLYGALFWVPPDRHMSYITLPSNVSISANQDGGTMTPATSPGTLTLTNVPFIGNNDGANQGFGTIYEMIFLSAGQSTLNQQKLEGYAAWKWDTKLGITTFVTALPGGHPYKAAPP